MAQDIQNSYLYYIFDGSFEGLFTCVFDAFYNKQYPKEIATEEISILFAESLYIATDQEKATRVLNGLKKKISPSALNMLFVCWLSEMKGVETLLFNYICKAFRSAKSIELNFSDSDVLELSKIYRIVKKEEERVRQFLRFQKTADNIYFAAIEPLCNVLPITVPFFQDRFADQQWIIYDIKRAYAVHYDLEKVEEVTFDDLKIDRFNGKLHPDLVAEGEVNYQDYWKQYIKSISIKERKNLKLQRQHMPKRFWKYLTEKQS